MLNACSIHAKHFNQIHNFLMHSIELNLKSLKQ